MRTTDLSHPLDSFMSVFPGDEPPVLRRTHTVKRDGFAQTVMTMSSHTGTHLDCAAHLFADAPGLDRLGPDNFTGWAAVVDLTGLAHPRIDQSALSRLADMDGLDFVLLRTGWDCHWTTDQYYQGKFPTLAETAARFLGGLDLKGIGLDTPSPDPVDSRELPAHRVLFDHGQIIVENLTNLAELPPEGFVFCCQPLPIRDGDGSPVRAVGLTF